MNSLSYQDFNSWKENAISNAVKFGDGSIDILEVNVHIILSFDEDLKRMNAHALEFDIVGEAKTRKDALKEVLEAIMNHISFCMAYNNQDKIVFPAPDKFWREFFEKLKEGNVEKKIPRKLNLSTSQMPFRESKFNQVCTVSG